MRKVLICFLVVMALGCNERTVVEGVSQVEANQIISLLARNGITGFSEKETGRSRTLRYTVSVGAQHYTQAVSLLTSHNLPAERDLTLDQLLDSGGFLPQSRSVEALRLDRARALQIEEALENHPGIFSARVVVNSGQRSSARLGETPKSGVSVVVQESNSAELPAGVVERLVASVLPAVDQERVVVSRTRKLSSGDYSTVAGGVLTNEKGEAVSLPLTEVFSVRVVADDAYWFTSTLGLVAVLLLALGVFLGVWWRRASEALTTTPALGPPRPSRSSPRVEERKPTSGLLESGE